MDAVIDRIQELGLEVAGSKTEAIWFVKLTRRRKQPQSSLSVNGEIVRVQSEMKHLGVTLDSRLTFGSHFARVAPKIAGEANFLGRLLRNVNGPGMKVSDSVHGRCEVHGPLRSSDLVRQPRRQKRRKGSLSSRAT